MHNLSFAHTDRQTCRQAARWRVRQDGRKVSGDRLIERRVSVQIAAESGRGKDRERGREGDKWGGEVSDWR